MQLQFYETGSHRAMGMVGDAAPERNSFSCTEPSSSSSPSCSSLGRCSCVKGRSAALFLQHDPLDTTALAKASRAGIFGHQRHCSDCSSLTALLKLPLVPEDAPRPRAGKTLPGAAGNGGWRGAGNLSSMTWSPAKLDPNQTFFFNFPVNWTFQRTVCLVGIGVSKRGWREMLTLQPAV